MSDTPTRPELPARPVLSGFHPDPSVCRVGEDYFLACSSFEYAPGVPIFRSKDLVTWELIGHALHGPGQLPAAGLNPSGGIYAPTLRHHDGLFWLITTNVQDPPGHLLVTAVDPAGPWSEPVRIGEATGVDPAAVGIDPDLAWDEAGTCYLTWSEPGIAQAVLDPATGRLLTAPRRIWSGTGGQYPEGPHLYAVDGRWYLMVSEGGTGHGHAVTIARGPSPAGPFEPCPDNPLLTARSTDSPVQNTGHADLVQRADGSWAMVFLGVRPRGFFPGWHVMGRETFACEIVWDDGWPRRAQPIQPVSVPALVERLGDELPPSWVAASVFPEQALRRSGEAWTLTAQPPTAQDGERSFVGRRQQHLRTTARAEVDASAGAGGLELRIDPAHAVSIEVDGGRARAFARIGSVTGLLGETPVTAGCTLELRTVTSTRGRYSHDRGPDEIVASVYLPGDSGPDGRVELGRLDGRYLSSEVAGGFTGRMVGLVCTRGSIVVRSFEYLGEEETAETADVR